MPGVAYCGSCLSSSEAMVWIQVLAVGRNCVEGRVFEVISTRSGQKEKDYKSRGDKQSENSDGPVLLVSLKLRRYDRYLIPKPFGNSD